MFTFHLDSLLWNIYSHAALVICEKYNCFWKNPVGSNVWEFSFLSYVLKMRKFVQKSIYLHSTPMAKVICILNIMAAPINFQGLGNIILDIQNMFSRRNIMLASTCVKSHLRVFHWFGSIFSLDSYARVKGHIFDRRMFI